MGDRWIEADEEATPPAWQPLAERINLLVLGLAAVAFAAALVWYLRHSGDEPLRGWWAVVLTGVLTLVCTVFAVLRPLLLTHRRTVGAALLVSMVVACGIVATWVRVGVEEPQRLSVGRVVADGREAGAEVTRQLKGRKGVTRVPTGVLLTQTGFDGPKTALLSGWVWQRVPPGVPRELQGVVFPEAEDSYATKEVYRHRNRDGTQTIGWYFQGTVHQEFDYRRYPLDHQNVWLRMWSTDVGSESVVLEPDFASYPPRQPAKLRGLDPGMEQGALKPYFTAWSYADFDYETSMGSDAATYANDRDGPDLFFNVGMKRDWQGPLLDSLTSSMIIALIIYLSLFVCARRKDEERRSVLGFDSWTVLAFTVSLLLVVVVDQAAVREVTGSAGKSYLEFFAFALYLVILGVSLNVILLSSDRYTPSLDWGNNRLAKLLYWPVLLSLILAATLWVFRSA